jgi:ketosteroid isomerase-like protein
MKRLMLAGLAALAMALPGHLQAQGAPARGGAPAAPADPDQAAIQTLLQGYATNVSSGSLDAVGALFTGGAHVLTGTRALHGFAEYKEVLQAEVAPFMPGLRYTHTGIETVVRGSVAWTAFRWTAASTMASGGPANVTGRGSAVFEKVDGKWMIVHLHISK